MVSRFSVAASGVTSGASWRPSADLIRQRGASITRRRSSCVQNVSSDSAASRLPVPMPEYPLTRLRWLVFRRTSSRPVMCLKLRWRGLAYPREDALCTPGCVSLMGIVCPALRSADARPAELGVRALQFLDGLHLAAGLLLQQLGHLHPFLAARTIRLDEIGRLGARLLLANGSNGLA